MASLDFSDSLSLAQTIAIIATLLMTPYFSKRQLKSLSLEMETRVLNDLDENFTTLLNVRRMEFWFDPSFQNFINTEILASRFYESRE
jgi:hypothetical protein